MVGESPARVNDLPYFFLSYRRSQYRPSGSSEPDRWIRKFYKDLCTDLHQLTSAPVPGYMDVQTPLGHDWPDELVEALCCCKVFVPLLTPGYFDSEWCGKEWAAFIQRMQMQAYGGKAPKAILPALWGPFRRYVLPSAVDRTQLIPPGFPKAYEDEGFYGLMKIKRYRGAYEESVWRMAQTIQRVGEEINLASCPAMTMDSIRNAFADHKARNIAHQIRVTIAAYAATSTSTGRRSRPIRARSNYYYGHTMREWMPYRSTDNTTLIARYAASVISELGHSAVLDPLDDRDDRTVAPQSSPSVMLVDPWAPGVPEIADHLRVIDGDPIHVVVPWNKDDNETARETPQLQARLHGTLPHSLSLKGSAPRVPTLEAFRAALPKAVNEAIAKHFRTAPAYPPARSGPTADQLLEARKHEYRETEASAQ